VRSYFYPENQSLTCSQEIAGRGDFASGEIYQERSDMKSLPEYYKLPGDPEMFSVEFMFGSQVDQTGIRFRETLDV
jgi:hypothetical protein